MKITYNCPKRVIIFVDTPMGTDNKPAIAIQAEDLIIGRLDSKREELLGPIPKDCFRKSIEIFPASSLEVRWGVPNANRHSK